MRYIQMAMMPSVLILSALLLVGFLSTRIASWIRIPHSVFLVVLGLIAGQAYRGHDLPWDSTHFPDLVFYVLLPPLVFEAAYELDLQHLIEDLVPISTLAVVAVGLSTLCIGYSLHGIFGIGLASALAFGALISATDPVAVVAMFRKVGAPKRLETLIDGEALFNDGTAMVLFRIFASLALGSYAGPPSALSITGGFLLVTLGSVAFGLVASGAAVLLLRACSGSPSAQMGVTLSAAYLSFLVADSYLGLSGVIATLVVGLIVGWRARKVLDEAACEGMEHLWGFITLSANTILFLAVGLIVEIAPLASRIGEVLATLAVVYAARAGSIFALVPILNRLGRSKPISWPYAVTLFWGGLRGGLALALVLTLPDDFADKKLFLSLATAVVLATLLVNAQTTHLILKFLKLDRPNGLQGGDTGASLKA